MALALTSANMATSSAVYATMVGFPDVPEEACTLTTSVMGVVSMPMGYVSRNSDFVVNGRSVKPVSTETPASFSRQ